MIYGDCSKRLNIWRGVHEHEIVINLFLGVCCLVCDIVHRRPGRSSASVYFLNANQRTKNRQTYQVSHLRRESHALQVILISRLDARNYTLLHVLRTRKSWATSMKSTAPTTCNCSICFCFQILLFNYNYYKT